MIGPASSRRYRSIPDETSCYTQLQVPQAPRRATRGTTGVTVCIGEEYAGDRTLSFQAVEGEQPRPQPCRMSTMSNLPDHAQRLVAARKSDGNPEGKGAHAFLADWQATTPRGIVSKSERQVLAEFFTSVLVLSATFNYRPVPGRSNYLYWVAGQWSLSLIAPWEWSDERRAGFVGTCVLQRDMTWTIEPTGRLTKDNPVADAVRRFFDGFARMLDTDLTLEEILPAYVGSLPYYQRLHASALSRSLRGAMTLGNQASISCRQWQKHLPRREHGLLASCC